MLNRILKDQVALYFGNEEIPEKYMNFFKAIGKTYNRLQKERKMLERMVDFGSEELIKLNTKLKKESLLLKQAESEIKTIFENTDVVFFSIDMINYKVNEMSVACEKVYGYKPEEFINNLNLWKEVIHPDDLYLVEKHDENLAMGKKLYYQYRIIHKDKSIRWIESKIIPALSSEGKLLRIDGMGTDITGKKESERKLFKTEQLLSEAQRLAKMGNWNIELISGEMFYSDELKNIFGVDKDYKPYPDDEFKLFHPEDREHIMKEILRTTETGETVELVYRIIRQNDGEVRIVQTLVKPVYDKEGTPKRIFGITRDITEQKGAELKIEQMNMLMYQISHDLRGPLNSAKNYIYLARRKVDNKTANDYLFKINDAYNKMEQRVMSLLDIQRMNRTNINKEKIDFRSLVSDITLSIDALSGFEEVTFSTDIKIRGEIYSDRQFLHSILYNLISNAIVHRKNSPGAIVKISAKEDRGTLVIGVTDNGEGIPLHMRDKVFDKFVKGTNSNSGVGLGLFIVSALVKRLEGEIHFKTEDGKGTTFIVKMPYMPAGSNYHAKKRVGALAL